MAQTETRQNFESNAKRINKKHQNILKDIRNLKQKLQTRI